MSLARPELLWLALLALPELLALARRGRGRFPSLLSLAGPRQGTRVLARSAAAAFYSSLAFVLFLASASLALAGPSWGRRGSAQERSGFELAFVLDVSRSMEVEDGAPTRLEAAKGLLRSLLRSAASASGREGLNAFSLVAAKGEAVLLVPMTEDLEALELGLDYANPDTLTAAGTDLGRGIAAGLGSFSSSSGAGRLLIVLSDGGELSGSARAEAAKARLAKARFIALGFGGSEPKPVPGAEGPALDEKGLPARSALDAAFLKSVAAEAGGRYLDGSDPGTPAALAAEISEAGRGGMRLEYEVQDRSGLFAFLALAFLALAILAEALLARGGRP
ncbi:MAG TPA: VWA domain-containing protein [Spirochaetales bacterium]|nr:VWA domain-containing protein [Spirochaetales bacterium]HRY53050.1 VWA domain-containing protein [Spirochaetia bacterium]